MYISNAENRIKIESNNQMGQEKYHVNDIQDRKSNSFTRLETRIDEYVSTIVCDIMGHIFII